MWFSLEVWSVFTLHTFCSPAFAKNTNVLQSTVSIVSAFFYNKGSNSRELIGQFSLSISRQTQEFMIYAMRQRERAHNLTMAGHV